jgi:hypothetical protein
MSAAVEGLAGRLGQLFTTLSLQLDERVLCQRICGGGAYCTVHFAIEAEGLRDLVKTFREDRGLWTDFLDAIRAYRPVRHWATLVEFVHEIGTLEGQLRILETCRGSPYPDERMRISRRLNDLDGEIANLHMLADRRNLATRVCKAAGVPLIDGLTMRGLTFALAVEGELLHALASLVESEELTQEERAGTPDCLP